MMLGRATSTRSFLQARSRSHANLRIRHTEADMMAATESAQVVLLFSDADSSMTALACRLLRHARHDL